MTDVTPQRIQISRKKGANLQRDSLALNGLPAIKVDRSGKGIFGNPFRVKDMADLHDIPQLVARPMVVDAYRHWLMGGYRAAHGAPPDFSALRGHNIACWCAIGAPCHGDVILDVLLGRPLYPWAAGERKGVA